MILSRFFAALLLAVGARAAVAQGSTPRLVHLATGDSAMVLSVTPLRAGPSRTAIVRFRAFAQPADTVAVRRDAVALWRALRTELGDADHVLLQEEGRGGLLARLRPGLAVVIIRTPDGRWVLSPEGTPLDGAR